MKTGGLGNQGKCCLNQGAATREVAGDGTGRAQSLKILIPQTGAFGFSFVGSRGFLPRKVI